MQITGNLQIDQERPPQDLSPAIHLELPPLKIRSKVMNVNLGKSNVDAILQIDLEGSEHTFLAEYRSDWTRRTLRSAIDKVLRIFPESPERNVYPLIILPYLSEEHLNELASHHISGLDLCGNGIVTVPGKWFVQRSGKPNRFRMNAAGVNPYKGLASLVSRTLLRQPQFKQLGALLDEIVQRGGAVSLALVSRAVQRLQEELIIAARPGMRVQLVQPEKLLDGLLRAYQPERASRSSRYRVALPTTEFLPRLFHAAEAHGTHICMTGLGSAAHHAPITLEDIVRVYTDNSEALIQDLPIKPGERFANLEIHAPRNPVVYFDLERDEAGVAWASPIQTYLEMMHAGDARLQQAAGYLRLRLLSELEQKQEEI